MHECDPFVTQSEIWREREMWFKFKDKEKKGI